MDNDKLKGKANEAIGTGKQKVGDMTGDDKMRAEGENQELKGKGQGVVGDIKEKVHDIKEKIT